jgi:hypothetical protein
MGGNSRRAARRSNNRKAPGRLPEAADASIARWLRFERVPGNERGRLMARRRD